MDRPSETIECGPAANAEVSADPRAPEPEVVDASASSPRATGLGLDASAQTTQRILQMISNEAVVDEARTSELLDKVKDSITEISAKAKPRKRARLRESIDWTDAAGGGAGAGDPEKEATAMEIVEDDPSASRLLADLATTSPAERKGLERLAEGLLGSPGLAGASGGIGTFALNAVVVLAKAAIKKDGEQHHARALQETLEKMHLQYTSLANETSCLQTKLKEEKDACSGLEVAVNTIQRDITDLREENEFLKGELHKVESSVQCKICYENKRNCLLMPCLHFMFCTRCMDLHFQNNEARLCPICRKGVSGVLVMQLE